MEAKAEMVLMAMIMDKQKPSASNLSELLFAMVLNYAQNSIPSKLLHWYLKNKK